MSLEQRQPLQLLLRRIQDRAIEKSGINPGSLLELAVTASEDNKQL